MDLTIRLATLSDLDVLREFEQGVIGVERAFAPRTKAETIYYNLEQLIHSDQSILCVAEIDAQPVASGYAKIEKSHDYYQHDYHAYVGFLYVLPEFRGKGVIGQVEAYLCSWAKEMGVDQVELEVYAENRAAVRAYEKRGYQDFVVRMVKSI